MSTDSDIRAGLQALAEQAGPPSLDGDDLASLVVREERSRRRRHGGVLAVAAAVAVVATAVPLALHPDSPGPEVATPVIRPADIYGLPTRGSLADDAEFVEAARRAAWDGLGAEGTPDAPLDTRRVVFAGEVGGQRLALVVGENTAPYSDGDAASASGLAAAWFVGSTGGPTLLTPPHGVVDDLPTALVAPGGGLIVVAAPGDEVAVSERPEIEADGSRTRSYEPVESADGITVHELARPAGGTTSVPLWSAVSYRVTRDGALVVRTMPDVTGQGTPDVRLRMHVVRPVDTTVGQFSVVSLLVGLGRTDLDSDAALQWAGPLPGVPRSTAAVATVTVPSGAVVVGADLQIDNAGGGYMSTSCGREVRAAGARAEDRIYAAACASPAAETTDVPEWLVVVAPQRVSAVRVYDDGGSFLSELPAADGVVTAPLPRHAAEVEAITAAGVSLGRTGLLAEVNLLGD